MCDHNLLERAVLLQRFPTLSLRQRRRSPFPLCVAIFPPELAPPLLQSPFHDEIAKRAFVIVTSHDELLL